MYAGSESHQFANQCGRVNSAPNNKMLVVAMKLKKSDFRSCQLPDTHTRSHVVSGTLSCGFIMAQARHKPATLNRARAISMPAMAKRKATTKLS